MRAKILMMNFWSIHEGRLGWVDPIPIEEREKWIEFFSEMFDLEKIKFNSCVKLLKLLQRIRF